MKGHPPLREPFIKTKETLINSAIPVHARSYILYIESIKNIGAKLHETVIF